LDHFASRRTIGRVPTGGTSDVEAMRSWTTKQAKQILEWARTPAEKRPPIEVAAAQLGRSVGAVQQFLRRVLPRGERPWPEKPRWEDREIEAVKNGQKDALPRSAAAIRKWEERHKNGKTNGDATDDDPERTVLTVSQAAADLGISRAYVYRLLQRGILRRFKSGIAETTFQDLLREHPEVVPYWKLPREHKEWLVLNGYSDPALHVKRPTTKGILDVD
jgi:excisionase family DNA binding protein